MVEMNIGILFPPSNLGGGVFQYALSIVDSLMMYSNKHNCNIIHYDTESLNWLVKPNLKRVNFISIPFRKASLIKKISFLFNSVLNCNIFKMQKDGEVLQLKSANVELLIIPFPSVFGFYNKIPYIVSIPDLMHKYYPHFPEYPLKERLTRDIVYKNASKHSVLTVVDDQKGVDDLNKFFKIPKDKIRVVPYMPPGYIYKHKDMDFKKAEDILSKYNLSERFLFYPAQFWYHKNHIRLIRALKHIEQNFKTKIPLVLVGSPNESYSNIANFIKKLNLEDQIIHLGYVSDVEIVALYKKAVSLVFPSLFGPTNIPPLEAMVLGTPVVCSNLFSMPEQVGDAGVLFDPNNIEDMAEKIYKIWTDEDLRKRLIQKAYEKVKDMTLGNYAKKWEEIIEEALKLKAALK
jgi:glycosyltransferase involved in cell wall biosynthesis